MLFSSLPKNAIRVLDKSKAMANRLASSAKAGMSDVGSMAGQMKNSVGAEALVNGIIGNKSMTAAASLGGFAAGAGYGYASGDKSNHRLMRSLGYGLAGNVAGTGAAIGFQNRAALGEAASIFRHGFASKFHSMG